METYTQYIRAHPELARRLPSLVPVLAYVLPARHAVGTEVLAETGYAISRLWALLHDHLLNPEIQDEDRGLSALLNAPVETK
jgi:hypothetical protein